MEHYLDEISQITVDRFVDQMAMAYGSLISRGLPLSTLPSVMLWGAPGVGKSQGIRELAEELEEKTGKRTVVTDVRLLLFNPVDLRGIPTANADKTLAVWLKPMIFQMDESPDVINILFLDEISAAPPSVQAAAYQITLDHAVGEHKLPDNCIVFAAGNRITDRSVAYNMPKALANRLCHFEIKGDSASWHRWAVRKGIHPFVTGYLEYNSSALMHFDSDSTDLAFPTPRSWEMVSNILTSVSDEVDMVYPMICGCIGSSTASRFRTWCRLYSQLPAAEDIFSGAKSSWPEEAELQLALKSAMVSYARLHPKQNLIDTSIDYSCRLPWGFRGKLLQDYALLPELKVLLEKNQVYRIAVRDGLEC